MLNRRVNTQTASTQPKGKSSLGINWYGDDSIKIEVPVNDIAKMLFFTLPEDYKHKELLVDTIIGSSRNAGHLNYLYNALNGFTNEIDFEVCDVIVCTEEERREVIWETPLMDVGDDTITGKPTRKETKSVEIGSCKVIEIDLYRNDKLKVQYEQDSYYTPGKMEKVESWVNHRKCTKSELQPVSDEKYNENEMGRDM